MENLNILKDKNILIVDDEADVLATLTDLLDMCRTDTASDFENAKRLLDENVYDIVILDIMGVKGYDLLEIARQKNFPALMLTAHAMSPDHFAKSISGGAKAYIPKEKMAEIAIYLSDLLNAQEGKEKPHRWFARLKSFFETQFGKGWLESYREIRDEMEKKYGPFNDLD